MRKLTVVAILLLIFTAAVMLGQFAGSSDEYSRYNTGWNGTSSFFGQIPDSQCIWDADSLTGKTGTLLLVISPSHDFTGEGLSAYLRAGNTILLFDQAGNANAFLSSLGSSITVHDAEVRSPNMEYKDAGLFRADVLENLFGTNVTHLFFNYPGYVTGGETIIQTSSLSWVDLDGDNTADANEPLKVYSLAASDTIGNGRIVVVADPSLFVNSMLDRKHTENMAVLEALLQEEPYIYLAGTDVENGSGITGLLSLLHRYPGAGVGLFSILFLCGGGIYLWRRNKS